MGTPHINAKEGAFAKTVLMPGDPKRAEWIAKNFLVDAELVTDVRNIFGYTGYTKSGKRISVMASGMGIPSVGIYSHELYSSYGVETIIRVGTCGTYQKNIKLFDVLIAVGACTDSNWASQFGLNGTYSAIADFELADKAYHALKAKGLPAHAGNVLSADVFYDEDRDMWKKWEKLGVMGVEMESYGLYTTAARLGKKALCLLSVTDNFHDFSHKATVEERQNGLVNMINLALEIAE